MYQCVRNCGPSMGTILSPCDHKILSDELKGIENEDEGKVKKRVHGR